MSKPKNRFNVFLGILVTLYGIMAAVVSYQSNQFAGKATEMNFLSVMELSRANDAYSLADQAVNRDDNLLIEVAILKETGADPVAADTYYGMLSSAALEAVERSGNLDDAYYEEMYAYGDGFYDHSIETNEIASEFNELSDRYNLILVLLAVGLSFAGWASLLDDSVMLRNFFTGTTMVMLIVILGLWMYTLTTPIPEIIIPL